MLNLHQYICAQYANHTYAKSQPNIWLCSFPIRFFFLLSQSFTVFALLSLSVILLFAWVRCWCLVSSYSLIFSHFMYHIFAVELFASYRIQRKNKVCGKKSVFLCCVVYVPHIRCFILSVTNFIFYYSLSDVHSVRSMLLLVAVAVILQP